MLLGQVGLPKKDIYCLDASSNGLLYEVDDKEVVLDGSHGYVGSEKSKVV